MKNKKIFIAFFLMALVIIVSSCADVTNVANCTAGVEPYGFWNGLWHGFISWFSFFGSLFSDDIALYAVNNNGGWYDFGFVLGAGILGGGARRWWCN